MNRDGASKVWVRAVLLIGVLSAGFAPTDAAMPEMPFAPWGTVRVNGDPPPEDTTVEAYIDGQLVASMPGGIRGSWYSLVIPADDPDTPAKDGGVEGDTVVVRVAGTAVLQQLTWSAGDGSLADLSVGARTLAVSVVTPACVAADQVFTSISSAVSGANSGETIIVCPGAYTEYIDVDRGVEIRGSGIADTTVISTGGSPSSTVFDVNAPGVAISGFTIQDAAGGAGVAVWDDNAVVTGNVFRDSNIGVWLGGVSSGHTVTLNTFTGNGSAIRVSNASNVTIADNTIDGNTNGLDHDPVGGVGSSGVEFVSNLVQNNSGSGVHLNLASNWTMTGNDIRSNAYGVRITNGSTGLTIRHNNILDNAYNMSSDSTVTVSALHNWWGSTYCALIDSKLYDDEEGQNEILFDPVLDDVSPIGVPVSCRSTPRLVVQVPPACVDGVVDQYPTIQEAVNASVPGDTIVVCPGLYEETVDIYEDLSIESHAGPETTTLRACGFKVGDACTGRGHAINIGAASVEVRGLTITGARGITGDPPFAGIKFEDASGGVVSQNIILDNDTGVVMGGSSAGNVVYDNIFDLNGVEAVDPGGNAWSIAKTAGLNIVDGPFLGGNWWQGYIGGDADGDGLGDVGLPYTAGGNIQGGGDYHPLIDPTAPPPPDDDPDFDGHRDHEDNCPDHYNPDQANTDASGATFSDDFEGGVFSGWSFAYSSDGLQSGSNAAGSWSSTVYDSPLSFSWVARLVADSYSHGAPWNVHAAIDTTVPAGAASASWDMCIHDIQGSGGVGVSYFNFTVIDAEDTGGSPDAITYAFSTTGDTGGDILVVVAPATCMGYQADFAQDFLAKYGYPLPGEVIIRFQSFADYAEGGSGRRITDVEIDNVTIIGATGDPLGDACDCEPLDGSLWAVPGEVGGLVIAGDKGTLSWDVAPDPGATVAHYDPLASESATDFEVSTDCILFDDPNTTATDFTQPDPGELWYYLVRAINDCGPGPLGWSSNGDERIGRSCP